MPSDVIVKLQKLARLARCPSALKGEAANAAAMVVKIARKNHVDLTDYLDLLAIASRPKSKPRNSAPPFVKPRDPPPVERPSVSKEWDSKPPYSTPPFTTPPYTRPSSPKPPRSKPKQFKPHTLLTAMPSGRYRGKTFREIFQFDPDYLFWVIKAHPTQEKITASISAFLKTVRASEIYD